MFFAAENLVTQSVSPSEPWTFKPTETITAQIRKDKESRQEWYQNIATKHNFYTALEGHSNTQRVSKDNPPRSINGFVADYDIAIPAERIAEAIKSMPFRPTYFENSLGGNFRLVWVLESVLYVDSRDFCTFILQAAHDWLCLGVLPGLDKKAFEETSRLYCNGCAWEPTGAGPIPKAKSQAFFVECGRKFRFKAGDDEQVPLDLVEKALRAKYPSFDWPGPFDLETQGPSFWIPESVSPQSAILKPGGFFTFAAHASKPFYSWTDLLGKDFTASFQADAISKATEDIWWDSKSFWRKKEGAYVPLAKDELTTYFEVTCRLSNKPGQNGLSPVKVALDHIYNHQHILGAAPIIFRHPGLIVVRKERKLNTYTGEPIQPAAGAQKWGPHGNFPFLSSYLETLFNPAHPQLDYFMAGHQYFYLCAITWEPQPGWNFFLLGGVGVGKTLGNRYVFGNSVGGFADAASYIVEGGQFNSHLLCFPHWCVDDDSPTNSPAAQAKVQAMFKKIAANQEHLRNAKYEKATMVPWAGRLGCTANLDFASSRIVGPLDNNSLDKTSLFRCHATPQIAFPTRLEIVKLLSVELPFYLRFLIDWKVPDYVERDNRYGYRSYQESSLMIQNRQSSPSASFKEVLIEFLYQWFKDYPKEKYWEGTISFLLKSIMASDCNEMILRTMRLEQVSRYLEQIQREASFKIEVRQGAHDVRLWRVYRHDAAN